ncbi:unnamed protein product [Cylicostephanus goldi]|uniref:Tubulin--tyrosine ligase-like protein 9 n=1 Tax=Cylicostephanus goldi TaxID=71465 RepID=A0A3P6Q7L6_CYLGO|nr:unnamed protein product [Cylicostephanus goldi]
MLIEGATNQSKLSSFRFCAEDYNPFDVNKLDKYVVGDDYTPIWEIPSLKDYFLHQKLGWKGAFDAYLRSQNQDPQKIWDRIDEIIAEVFQKQQVMMLHALKSVQSKANFFELSRFDFVVDENLNVFLMEANMSPNLSSGHFAQNQILYEQVLYNVFSLVGIASAFTKEVHERSRDYDNAPKFLAPDQSIYLIAPECSNCSSCDAMMVGVSEFVISSLAEVRHSAKPHCDEGELTAVLGKWSIPHKPLILSMRQKIWANLKYPIAMY